MFVDYFQEIQEYPEVAKKADSVLEKQLTKGELKSLQKIMLKYLHHKTNDQLEKEIIEQNKEIERLKGLLETMTDILQ